ncbi:MAG: nicotinamidase-related amidase [Gammaproteobacteria bacterium]|jgi:nicotinamidase-related amidase
MAQSTLPPAISKTQTTEPTTMITPTSTFGLLAATVLALGAGLSTSESQPTTTSALPQTTAIDGKFELLTPENSTLLLIDHQPQMVFGVRSHDRQTILNNVEALAKSAKAFKVPTVLTTVAAESFSGPIIPQIKRVFPDKEIFDRTSMNAWDEPRVVKAITETGRKKLIIAALWTEVCLTMPTLEALNNGYDVYIVTDASGGTSKEAHDMAVERMVQAGAIPVTWQQVMLEWQRDWSHQETYDAVTGIAMEHSGAYGAGINYAYSMLGSKENH